MTKRLTLWFVPLLPVISLFAGAWFFAKGRPTAPTYRGKTASEWEHELEQWQAIDYDYYYRHQTRWSMWKAMFGLQVPARDLVDERLVAAIHEPDPEAIPVLTELLGARETSV